MGENLFLYLTSFIEIINTFAHDCFTQIYAHFLNMKNLYIFFGSTGCGDTYHTNGHGDTLKTYIKKLKTAEFLALFL